MYIIERVSIYFHRVIFGE